MTPLVIGIGEVLWDLLPAGKKLGGAPANFVFHVNQFGLPARLVSAVGADTLGLEIVSTLGEAGIEDLLPEVPFPTGTVGVTLDSKGIPHYDITRGVAWDNIPFTPALDELSREVSAVAFGSLAQRSEVSRTTIGRFIDAVAANNPDALIVFDINLRGDFYTEETVLESLRRCNILKINDEELEILCPMLGIPDADRSIACPAIMERFGLKILILTCGSEGSHVFTPGSISFLPTPTVEVADTVGAGDSFTAAFVSSLLRGLTVREAHETATATAAFVCTNHGATPLLPPDLINPSR